MAPRSERKVLTSWTNCADAKHDALREIGFSPEQSASICGRSGRRETVVALDSIEDHRSEPAKDENADNEEA
jgi:hypothetical protein